MKLSVCMIAHNEEAKIANSLQSVSFADEVILIDCESSDRTVEIAEQFGAKVHSRSNNPNLNVNKNFSFDQACGDFILSIDADEVIPPDLAAEIAETIENNPQHTAWFIPRRNYYFGRWLKHGGNYPDRQLRLFKRGEARFPEKHVHERIRVDGSIGRLKQPMDHFTYQSTEECREKLVRYADFEARHLYTNGVRPSILKAAYFLYWMPLLRFVRRYIIKLGFLDGRAGWEAIKLDTSNFRLRYRRLREMADKENKP